MEKQELRQIIKAELKQFSLNKEQCEQKSIKACSNIINSSLYKNARQVFLFLSYGTEIQTDFLINTVLKSNKELYLPKTKGDSMLFCKIEKSIPLDEQLEKGDFGILVPADNNKVWDFCNFADNSETQEILVIVPGLGFSKDGHRLGKGKGFYDKFLEKLLKVAPKKTRIVGLCYDLQVKPTIPVCKTDIKMQYIATESTLLDIQ